MYFNDKEKGKDRSIKSIEGPKIKEKKRKIKKVKKPVPKKAK